MSRGWLGVQIQPVTAEIADVLSLKQAQGALVAEPVADGPAAKAGVISGDVIASVDGKAIKDAAALSKRISGTAPGTSVKLGVIRDGKEQTIDVALGELPVANAAASPEQHGQANSTTLTASGGDLDGRGAAPARGLGSRQSGHPRERIELMERRR